MVLLFHDVNFCDNIFLHFYENEKGSYQLFFESTLRNVTHEL